MYMYVRIYIYTHAVDREEDAAAQQDGAGREVLVLVLAFHGYALQGGAMGGGAVDGGSII